MNGIPRPSAAMVVAIMALVVAIGGTAVALPGKYTVGRDDLKNSSVGARALGRMLVGHSLVMKASDPTAGDGVFTETKGVIRCPAKSPLAIDPSIAGMGPRAFEVRQFALSNGSGFPAAYQFVVSSDEGPEVGYTMQVTCLFNR